MRPDIHENDIYLPSEMVVAREIEGELILVPLDGGIADFDDALYSFNETGRKIWALLEPDVTVAMICKRLAEEYDASERIIREEVSALILKLLELKIVKKVN